ncbi:PAS domain S-box protein [Actinoplanes sp. NPDC023714]|uniref:PAS domain S-box protein n=1 Tax=Actinoplanes sp. NPDC023714 TaxID=3154322 RepID=UPI0033EAD468
MPIANDVGQSAIGADERAELERLRQVVSTAPNGFVSIDEDDVVTDWNPAAARLLGWEAGEIVGRPLTETLIPEEFREAHTAGMARYLATGRPSVIGRPVSLPALHRDGHRVEVELTIWPSWVRGQRHFYAFLRDISEQRAAAERAARRTNALLSTIEVQRAVTSAAGDRELALRVVAEQAVTVVPAANGAVVELIEGDVLAYTAGAGAMVEYAGYRIPINGSLSGVAVTESVAVCCEDTQADPRVDPEAARRHDVRSLCIAPLYHGDRVLGVLKVTGPLPGAFDEDDVHHLQILATGLGSALIHADDYARNAALLAQRTRALEALEASETRFRLTFENSPLGLALSSLEPGSFGRYIHTNPAMSVITGYSAEELSRMTFRDLHHPDDAAATEEGLRRMIADGVDTVRGERRYLHKDGHVVWASVRIAVVRDAGAVPSYVVVQAEDVTAQRASDARLHQQALLLELIPAAVIVRDLDGCIQWWNSGASELYGWSRTAARGKPTHRLLGTAFVGSGSIEEQREMLVAEGRWEGQLQHLTATGRTLTVLSRQILHQPADADGPPQVLEINTDITAARAAEQALAVNEQRFRAQFTHSAAGQVIRALDGTLIAVNRAFAEMIGRAPEDLAGRNVDAEVMRPEDRRAAHHQIAELFAGERDSYTHELQIKHADGHWVDIDCTVSLVRDPSGRPKHLILVCTDTSARRAAERARDQAAAALAERNAELETANQLKLDILGMLGHEISNPLSAILGYSDLLADELAADTPHGRSIAIINRHAQRLDDIVREVLAMVSIDTGNINAVRQRISLRREVEKVIEDVPLAVTGDDVEILFHPGHLQQIVVNLLSNAAKYAGGATGLTIAREGDRAVLRVEDRGPGVPEEFRPRLFERLTRADRDAGKVRGTGLGLYIVRSLAQANNGDVRYEPNPEGGSVFILEADVA